MVLININKSYDKDINSLKERLENLENLRKNSEATLKLSIENADSKAGNLIIEKEKHELQKKVFELKEKIRKYEESKKLQKDSKAGAKKESSVFAGNHFESNAESNASSNAEYKTHQANTSFAGIEENILRQTEITQEKQSKTVMEGKMKSEKQHLLSIDSPKENAALVLENKSGKKSFAEKSPALKHSQKKASSLKSAKAGAKGKASAKKKTAEKKPQTKKKAALKTSAGRTTANKLSVSKSEKKISVRKKARTKNTKTTKKTSNRKLSITKTTAAALEKRITRKNNHLK